jgi:hypothetical protein
MHDPKIASIVISIQGIFFDLKRLSNNIDTYLGTITMSQILLDLNAKYFPLLSGAAHQGMLRAAQHIFDKHFGDLLKWCKSLKVFKIACTGHSLGAGTANLLTILLLDKIQEFKDVTRNTNFSIRGYCFAPPGLSNHALADRYVNEIDNFVMENDIVSRLSITSVHGLKEMAMEADRLTNLKLSKEEIYKGLFRKREQLLAEKKDILGIIPGKVYHIYKTVRRIPRSHHSRYNVKNVPFTETAYRTVRLPASENPEIPHFVLERAEAEFFAYLAPRRHYLSHHMPWQYIKGIYRVRAWLDGSYVPN